MSPSTDTETVRGAGQRPGVSVLVPFAGGVDHARQMAAALAVLELGPADEGVVADNSPAGVLDGVELPPGWRSVKAEREGSPAHTRNTAALAARCDWFLFLDSDTQAPHDLIDRFFARPIGERLGVIGGRVVSDLTQHSLAARWADSRGMTVQEHNVEHPYKPYLLSACLLTRRETFAELGGFYEGIFNGEDVDFCWRAQAAGWKLELDTGPAVVHMHRDSVRALLKQAAVRGASATWVHRRWPQATQPVRPGPVNWLQGIVVSPLMVLAGQPQRAALRLLDVATQAAERWGSIHDNRAREREPAATAPPVELWLDEFPLPGTDGRSAGLIVAARRPDRQELAPSAPPVRYLEDDTALERWRALAGVVRRRPAAALRELRPGRTPSLRVLAPAIRRLLDRPGTTLLAPGAGQAAAAANRAARVAGVRVDDGGA